MVLEPLAPLALLVPFKTSMLRRVKLWLPPLLYVALIFHFSSESTPLPELTAHVWDKLLHVAEYGGLAFLLSRALVGEGVSRTPALITALLLASAYGASDEWHQAFVPSRSSDVRDWVADTVGAAVGVAGYRVLEVLGVLGVREVLGVLRVRRVRRR